METTVVFDFETGGVTPSHPNIQLAAIAVDENWDEIDSFESKIAFDVAAADPEALAMNHYSADAWKDAPASAAVFARFNSFLKRHATCELISKKSGRPYTVARIAAYNVGFDKDRLWAMAQGAFVPASHHALCIMQRAIWWSLETGTKTGFKLSEVAQVLGVDSAGAHDALADVRIAAKVAKALCLASVKS